MKGDYVLAIIDGKNGERRVKIFRRSESVESRAKTEEGKKLLDSQLRKNPILCYPSADKLPMEVNPDDQEAAELSERLTNFIQKNKKLLNLLAREGYSPLETLGLIFDWPRPNRFPGPKRNYVIMAEN